MFIFAKELLFIAVYVTMDVKYETTEPPIWILPPTTTNKREGRSKLIGKNRQYNYFFYIDKHYMLEHQVESALSMRS
jgi:hypothetical protein